MVTEQEMSEELSKSKALARTSSNPEVRARATIDNLVQELLTRVDELEVKVRKLEQV